MDNTVFTKHFLWVIVWMTLIVGSASHTTSAKAVMVGANQTASYLPLLKGKKVGLIVNQTSLIGLPIIRDKHLVDSLLALEVDVVKIFSPEHGFRGKADAGAVVNDSVDIATGLPIISLYGSNKKPSQAQLEGIDVLIFDIQDVGARFYTYISTMSLAMEACAEAGISFIVLDRPNPNGFYVDGPTLEFPKYKTFVGMHPVPIVHGMTVGEYAQMVNGEGWLKGGITCELTVIKVNNYFRNLTYRLPVAPSPNLPNWRAVALYPSLCLFEGTVISVGRGTEYPFQQIGHPAFKDKIKDYSFTPTSGPGASSPKLEGEKCYGLLLNDLSDNFFDQRRAIDLTPLLHFYNNYPNKEEFFTNFFDKLAGGASLRTMIQEGKTEDEIRQSWASDLERFIYKRKPYLIYPDIDHNEYLNK